jgi:cytochrome c biogenesis protein
MVEYGLLARGEDHRLAAEAEAVRTLLSGEWQLDPARDAAGPESSPQTSSFQQDNYPGAATTAGPATTQAGPTGPEKDQ